VYTVRLPHPLLNLIIKSAENSLITQGGVGDKPFLATIDTRMCVTVVRPDIVKGWPE
jgi:hypothetical protein